MHKGIKFVERDVSSDRNAAMELQSLGFSGVPAFSIDGESFVGFDLERILKAVDYSFIQCPNCRQTMRIPKGIAKLNVTCPQCQHAFKIARKRPQND